MTTTQYRKAVAYLRVSTDEQADKGLGLEAQRAAIESASSAGTATRGYQEHSTSRAAPACGQPWTRCVEAGSC